MRARKYETGFQCPTTGIPIKAVWACGRLSFVHEAHLFVPDKPDVIEKTENWCRVYACAGTTRDGASRILVAAGVDGSEAWDWEPIY